jgi:hypothetical protein
MKLGRTEIVTDGLARKFMEYQIAALAEHYSSIGTCELVAAYLASDSHGCGYRLERIGHLSKQASKQHDSSYIIESSRLLMAQSVAHRISCLSSLLGAWCRHLRIHPALLELP